MLCPSHESLDAFIPIPDFSLEETASQCSPYIMSSDPFPRISPDELVDLMSEPQLHSFDTVIIMDARYPYEFNGGHIRGAVNIFSQESFSQVFDEYAGTNSCLVFHCEFSKNRGPDAMQRFRALDRSINKYPDLSYPNLFLLDGGYAKFYREYPESCEGSYTTMRDDTFVHSGELRRSYSYQNQISQIASFSMSQPSPSIRLCLVGDSPISSN